MSIDNATMRWKYGREGFLLDLERGVFNPSGYDVVRVREQSGSAAFVGEHHYSGTWKGGGLVFDLMHHAKRVGVAVYSQPGGPKVLGAWFPGHEKTSLELSRLVLLDEVPFNAETWMLARTRDLLWRDGYTGVVSYSDPMPRPRADGSLLFPGHVGTTYKAASAIYTGQTKGEAQWLFRDGTVFPSRDRTKIRAFAFGQDTCKGWDYAKDVLLAQGAPPFEFAFGDERASAWCDSSLRASSSPRCRSPEEGACPSTRRPCGPATSRTT